MNILAIDPGPEQSAYVVYDGARVFEYGKVENELFISYIDRRDDAFRFGSVHTMVLEQVASMGMAVGEDVFETCVWTGRFIQEWGAHFDRVKRHEVKMCLCNHPRAKDANIRQALIDRYGGKDKAIGRKKSPGPLFGISGDCWSALAVAITYLERTNAAKESA